MNHTLALLFFPLPGPLSVTLNAGATHLKNLSWKQAILKTSYSL